MKISELIGKKKETDDIGMAFIDWLIKPVGDTDASEHWRMFRYTGDPLEFERVKTQIMLGCDSHMSDNEFKALANEKGRIMSAIKKAVEKEGWVWMVVDEAPKRIVVEIRRC